MKIWVREVTAKDYGCDGDGRSQVGRDTTDGAWVRRATPTDRDPEGAPGGGAGKVLGSGAPDEVKGGGVDPVCLEDVVVYRARPQ